MARRVPMSYGEAIRLLAREDSKLINALDQALGLGLLVVTRHRDKGQAPVLYPLVGFGLRDRMA